MSAWTFDRGGIDKLPECEVCGCPTYGARLCGLCCEWFEVGPEERVESVPIQVIINPQDLME